MNRESLHSMSNDELIDLYKKFECNMEKLSKNLNITREGLRKIFIKKGIDFSEIKKSYKASVKLNYELNPKLCEFCGKPLSWNERKNRFCSKTCGNKYRKVSEETKRKISNSLLNSNRKKLRICSVCGSQYYYQPGINTKKCCCKECSTKLKSLKLTPEVRQKLSDAGKKSAYTQAERRRSKNEKMFCELCEKQFENVLHNEPLFNGWDADVIIEDIKYAILWNGPWHRRKITKKHSVKQVQNRDSLKLKEILNSGYTPYIIDDNGKYNPQFVEEQFNIFINKLKGLGIIK